MKKNVDKNKAEIKKVMDAMKKVAEAEGCQPSDVSYNKLVNSGLVTDYQIKRIGGMSIIKSQFPFKEKDLATIQDFKKDRTYISKLEKELGNKLNVEELIKEQIKRVKPVSIKPYKAQEKKKIKRAVNVILSDLHIGSDIKKKETGHLDFGRVEEARRLARITKEVLEYKTQYRKETELNVTYLGDLIQNSLHDPRDGAPLMEQMIRCINLLTQQLAHFANGYPKVNVYFNGGNHGRDVARHKGRATNQKWANHEMVIMHSLKETFRSYSNVTFNIPLTPYVTYEVFGKKVFLSHGDSVLNVGYPGSSINTTSLENQINKINSTLNDSEEYSVFCVGHVHTGSIIHLSNGAVVLTNGAMVPSDEYAISIGLFENYCGQQLFESVEGYPVGDCRFIKVSYKDDKDSSLDKIIKPFNEF